jgi:hypothetical protein
MLSNMQENQFLELIVIKNFEIIFPAYSYGAEKKKLISVIDKYCLE